MRGCTLSTRRLVRFNDVLDLLDFFVSAENPETVVNEDAALITTFLIGHYGRQQRAMGILQSSPLGDVVGTWERLRNLETASISAGFSTDVIGIYSPLPNRGRSASFFTNCGFASFLQLSS